VANLVGSFFGELFQLVNRRVGGFRSHQFEMLVQPMLSLFARLPHWSLVAERSRVSRIERLCMGSILLILNSTPRAGAHPEPRLRRRGAVRREHPAHGSEDPLDSRATVCPLFIRLGRIDHHGRIGFEEQQISSVA
jgi:hypothetical protein